MSANGPWWIPDFWTMLPVLVVSVFSAGPILFLLFGLREVRMGSFDERAWGLTTILVAIVSVRSSQKLFTHAAQAHPGLMALGVGIGVIAGIMLFRTSKRLRHFHYSRVSLWVYTGL